MRWKIFGFVVLPIAIGTTIWGAVYLSIEAALCGFVVGFASLSLLCDLFAKRAKGQEADPIVFLQDFFAERAVKKSYSIFRSYAVDVMVIVILGGFVLYFGLQSHSGAFSLGFLLFYLLLVLGMVGYHFSASSIKTEDDVAAPDDEEDEESADSGSHDAK